jgi:hypothetical protein
MVIFHSNQYLEWILIKCGSLNNIGSIIGGILIFGQNIGNWGFYMAGMICAIIGTVILGSYQMEGEIKKQEIES